MKVLLEKREIRSKISPNMRIFLEAPAAMLTTVLVALVLKLALRDVLPLTYNHRQRFRRREVAESTQIAEVPECTVFLFPGSPWACIHACLPGERIHCGMSVAADFADGSKTLRGLPLDHYISGSRRTLRPGRRHGLRTANSTRS